MRGIPRYIPINSSRSSNSDRNTGAGLVATNCFRRLVAAPVLRSEIELRELLIGCLVAAPVFRSELELRELLIGIYRSIPRTAPPCFQYTELPLLGRFPPLLPFRALGVNSGFRLKLLSSVSFNAKSNLMVTMSF